MLESRNRAAASITYNMLSKGGDEEMKLFDDVIVKATGKKGTIVDEGISNGKHYFIVELDDISEYEGFEGLPTCREDELIPAE